MNTLISRFLWLIFLCKGDNYVRHLKSSVDVGVEGDAPLRVVLRPIQSQWQHHPWQTFLLGNRIDVKAKDTRDDGGMDEKSLSEQLQQEAILTVKISDAKYHMYIYYL